MTILLLALLIQCTYLPCLPMNCARGVSYVWTLTNSIMSVMFEKGSDELFEFILFLVRSRSQIFANSPNSPDPINGTLPARL